jgi:uncharacterized protein YxeA
MSKKKIFKILGVILLVIIAIFLIHTIRNYIIITDLQNKIAEYSDSTNYYMKSTSVSDEGMNVTMEYYKKDNKQVVLMEKDLNGEILKLSMYDNGERTDTFTETSESKVVQLNNDNIMTINLYNFLETENNWQTLLGSISARVKSTNYNGKECYVIKGFLSSTSLTSEGQETYIEKDTGLYLKTIEEDITTEREYEFDNVDDSVFVEPDIGQYTLKE